MIRIGSFIKGLEEVENSAVTQNSSMFLIVHMTIQNHRSLSSRIGSM